MTEPIRRAIVIAAGPVTHFVIAFMFFALWLGLVGQVIDRGVKFAQVAPQLNGHVSPAAAAGKRNVMGTQFHPEKSGPDGLRLYANFLALCA